jgi:hypothetical protein
MAPPSAEALPPPGVGLAEAKSNKKPSNDELSNVKRAPLDYEQTYPDFTNIR